MTDPHPPSTGDVHLDAAGLRTLAHPLRSRLLTQLRLAGPATATGLADALETNSGATSYHLRRLAEVGLITETGTGRGRERVWRASSHSHSWTPSDFAGDPDAEASLDWLDRHYAAVFAERYEHWLAAKAGWPQAWWDGAGIADTVLTLSASELLALREELEAVVERYRGLAGRRSDDDRHPIALYTFAFPSEP